MSAISAKAMNSTLGTPNFKGLDEILRDIITIPKGLVAPLELNQESLYFYLSNDYMHITGDETIVGSAEFTCKGSVAINTSIYAEGENARIKVSFYKNGELDNTRDVVIEDGDYTTFKYIFSFSAGDILEMRTQSLSGYTGESPTLVPVPIYAKEVNLNGIK